jgi:CreA protein
MCSLNRSGMLGASAAVPGTRMKKLALTSGAIALVLLLALALWIWSRPERGTTGEVSTHFRLIGPNDKIVVDTSDASIACRQVGPIRITGELKDGESVFDERRSLIFKRLHVVRFHDRKRNVLVYVSYSERVIEGSPKNSISTVPVMGWVAPR